MSQSTYDPVCANCHTRPKMDRCGVCEECWYEPPRYSELWWSRHDRRQEELRIEALVAMRDSAGGLF